MPRPKGRKKPPAPTRKPLPAIVEILPPESTNEAPPAPPIIEVKHKTEWTETRPPAPTNEDFIFEEVEPDPEEVKPRKNSFEELRNKLQRAGAIPGQQLKLTIEKYIHSEAIDGAGGHYAEKEHCTKYQCAEEHVKNEDYLDVARRFGPGLYRFTLRLRNMIVTAWDRRISAAATNQIVQPANPLDPSSPKVVLQTEGGQTTAQHIGVIDPLDQMVKTAAAYQKLRKAFEPEAQPAGAAPAPPAAPTDPKLAALSLIAENPEVMEKVASGIAKTVLGNRAGDSDPWADVALEAVKSGQAVAIVRAAIDSIFSGINGLFPKAGGQPVQQNGQSQGPPGATIHPQHMAAPMAANLPQAGPPRPAISDESPQAPPPTMTTEEQALALVIEHCRRNAPVKVAFNRLINFADAIEDNFPAGSIYDYVEIFGKAPTDAALDYVRGLPGGPEVIALPHCRAWTADLQKMIRESVAPGPLDQEQEVNP